MGSRRILNDEKVGKDGLLEPAEFRTPRWFTILIVVAVIVSGTLGLIILL